ncbi:hypothetical protein SAMN05518847_104176 [Paenibacillus sp. OV219]|nr:hypothetical protein SAMN05518847_104176 [Paenibacillus sp. OV219]
MKISYEIKTMNEFKKLPLICNLGIILFYLGAVCFSVSVLSRMFEIEFLNQVNGIPYSIGMMLFGFVITILFDKDRAKKTKVGKMRPH